MVESNSRTSGPHLSAGSFVVRLVAATLLVNLFVIGLAGFSLYQSRSLYESRAATQTQNLSRSLSLTIAAIIDKANIALFSAQRDIERQIGNGSIDGKSLNQHILDQQEKIPELDGMRIVNARGEIAYGDRVSAGPRVSIADRDFFRYARLNPKAGLIITKPMLGRISKHWVFYIARRINNPDGSFAGIAAASISLDYLSKLFSTFDLGREGVVTLRDGELAVVVRYPEPAGATRSIGSKKVSHELKELVQGGEDSGTYKTPGSIDTVERTFSYSKVAHYPLVVIAGLATGCYLAPWYNEVKQMLSLLSLFILGSLASAWSIYRNWKREKIVETQLHGYREHLEETVRERTRELETKNLCLAEEMVLRRQAEADLKKAAIVLDRMPDAVEWISREGKFLYVNDAACRTLGYSREELLSMSIFQVTSCYDAQSWQLHWEELKREGYLNRELANTCANEVELPVEVTANYLEFDGVEYNCAIIRDISERKEAEAEKQHLMAQLNQAQKIESIGRLAGGISHDFNNLLTPILGYSEMLMGSLAPDTLDYRRVNNIMQAADRARILTQQLLSFSRKQILEMKVVDLNTVIISFYEILRRTIPESIDIRLGLTEDSYGIHADSNRLEQILMNLTINAKDALNGKGAITIETGLVTLDDEYVRQHAEVTPGRYLMLAVTDSGSGMDQETLNHIYEPFFTTKGVGKGTGLGLATVYGIVKQHKGHIWVYSELGKGTVFKIYFPVVDNLPAPETRAISAFTQAGAEGGCILMVDDNEMVRAVVSDLLGNHGYQILVAAAPKQALLMSRGEQIDLLLTDIVMPDMDGLELHRKLLETHEGMKVIFMSGYTDNVIADFAVHNEVVHFVQKPFSADGLINKIQAVLSGPAAP